MNSETIIVGLCCLFLAMAFFLFKSQIFILLNRLAKIEFRGAKNLGIKTEIIPPRDTKPWAWYKEWINFILHPKADRSKAFLSEPNISFRQAYIWVTVVSIVYCFSFLFIFWIKLSSPIDIKSIFNLFKECLLVGLFFPFGIIIFTGFVHILAKLFGSKGTFQKLFIIYVAYNTRPILLYTVTVLAMLVFEIKALLYLNLYYLFYLLLVPITKAIKTNYHFHWIGSFLIGIFVEAVFFLSFIALFMTLNPNIIKP